MNKEKILEKLKKEYLDPFDSIKEWLYCLINFIDLDIDLNNEKNKFKRFKNYFKKFKW